MIKFHRATLGNFAKAIDHTAQVHGPETRLRVLRVFGILIAW